MSVARPFLQGPFPAASVLSPIWPNVAPYEPDGTLGWSTTRPAAATAMQQAEPVVRALMFSGWKVTNVTFALEPLGLNWLEIDLSDRGSWVNDTPPESLMTGECKMMILAEPIRAPDGASHAIAFGPSETQGMTVEATPTRLFVELVHEVANSTDINTCLDGFAPLVSALQDGAISYLNTHWGQTAEAGLTWLLDPAHWFEEDGIPYIAGKFPDVLGGAAGELLDKIKDSPRVPAFEMTSEEFLRSQFENHVALPDFGGFLSKTYAQLASDSLLTDLGRMGVTPDDVRWKLPDAVHNSAWWDVICMMVKCDQILPPLLGGESLSPYFLTLPPVYDPITVEAHNLDENTGAPQELVIYLHYSKMVTLEQANHWLEDDDGAGPRIYTPDIRENVAWEYLGIIETGVHGLALTVGRGVKITEHQCTTAYELDVVWSQIPSNIPQPLLEPPQSFDVAGQEADSAMFDAQPLAHMAQNRPTVLDGEFGEAQTVGGIDRAHPPFLVSTPMGNGAVKLEWFYRGGSGPLPDGPGTSDAMTGEDLGQIDLDIMDAQLGPPPKTFEMLIRPKRKAGVPDGQARPERHIRTGDFALCYDIDYVVLRGVKRTRNPDNTTYEGMGGGSRPVSTGPNAYYDRPVDIYRAILRIWYAGDVDIDYYRNVQTAGTLWVEMVKMDDPQDVPEQGSLLPSRMLNADYLSSGSHPWQQAFTGAFTVEPSSDDTVLPPSLAETDTTLLRGFGHVSVMESYWRVVGTSQWPSFGHTPEWGTTRYYLIPQDRLDGWAASGHGGEPIVATIKVDAPTWAWTAFTILTDVGVGFIPIVGDLVDVSEFVYAAYTGKDKWGNPVATWEIALMGVGACVPFVSNGMVKGGKIALTGAVIGGASVVYMSGDGAADQALGTFWRVVRTGADHADEIEALQDAMEASGRNLRRAGDRDAQIAMLREMLPHAELQEVQQRIARLAQQAARLGYEVGDAVKGGLIGGEHLIHMTRDATGKIVPQFIFDGMETAYQGWRNRQIRKGVSDAENLTRGAFLDSRASSSGRWRMVLETLGGADLIGKGKSQARALWPGLTHLVFELGNKIPPAEIATALRNRGAVLQVITEIPARHAEMVARHQDTILDYLEAMSEAEIQALLGSRNRSPQEVVVVMAHLFHHADEWLEAADTSIDRLDDLRPALDELMKSGITGSGYQHGALFEFFGNAYRLTHSANRGSPLVRFQTMLWAGAGKARQLGPDLTEFDEFGFGFAQYKSLSELSKQVGEVAYQDNMIQLFKDFYRLSKSDTPWKLDPDQVPEGALNVFRGKYASVLNIDQIRAGGENGLGEFWRLWGGEIVFDLADDFAEYGDEFAGQADAFVRALESANVLENGRAVITNLDDFKALMARMDDDAFTFLETWLTGRQAVDMQKFLDSVDTMATLQTHMTANPRAASLMMHFVNKMLPEGQKVTRATMQAEGGAELAFDVLGLTDGWFDVGRQAYHTSVVEILTSRGADALNQLATSASPNKTWAQLTEAERLTALNKEFPFGDVTVMGFGKNKLEQFW